MFLKMVNVVKLQFSVSAHFPWHSSLTGQRYTLQLYRTLHLVVMFDSVVMTDIPDGLHKNVGS